jgi:D-sedoheptulose 7-phosphate isomerase
VTAAEIVRARAQSHLEQSASVMRSAVEQVDEIVAAATLIATAFSGGHKLLLCGNGGSAADCQHVACEFVARLTRHFERPALPAIALTTDTSFITGYMNDFGGDNLFARQVEALGQAGDVLWGISTSGSSPNVLRAARTARARGMDVVVLTGASGPLAELATVAIHVPSDVTQFIQETHLAVEHIICDIVERTLFDPAFKLGIDASMST